MPIASHYLYQWWCSSLMLLCVARSWLVGTCVIARLINELTSHAHTCSSANFDCAWAQDSVFLTKGDLLSSSAVAGIRTRASPKTHHDDVNKWKHFPRYWPFVRGIHRWPVNSPHKGQWHGAFMFSLICTWINAWVNNHEADDLRRNHAHYDVTVMDCDVTIRMLAIKIW